MKKTLVLICILVIAALLVIGGCKKKEEVPTPPVTPPTPTEEVTPTPTTPTPTETPQVTETGEVQYGTRGILSDVKCTGKTISAIITNVQDTTMKAIQNSMESDLIIQVNGNRMQEFVCDKTEIGPNGYTYCSDLVGNAALKEKMVRTTRVNEVEVWFKGDNANRGVVEVNCSAITE
jgi:hypothetical protein